MTVSPNQKIQGLISFLPSKDIPIAKKHFINRDIDLLKELVDSAIYKIKKNLKSESPREDYLKLDLDKLYELQSTINAYLILIGDVDDTVYEDEDDEGLNPNLENL